MLFTLHFHSNFDKLSPKGLAQAEWYALSHTPQTILSEGCLHIYGNIQEKNNMLSKDQVGI